MRSLYLFSMKPSFLFGKKEGMLLRTSLFLFLAFLLNFTTKAQDTLHQESFETDGEGTRYTTSGSFHNGANDLFQRIVDQGGGSYDPNLSLTAYDRYVGQVDSAFWAAEDVDDNGGSDTASLTTDTIGISGYTDYTVNVNLAAGDSASFDGTDLIDIQVRIDSGSWKNIGQFRNDGSNFNTEIGLDANMDGVLDSTVLDSNFTAFNFRTSGTGSYLEVRVLALVEADGEEIAFDHILVEGTKGCRTFGVTYTEAFDSVTVPNLPECWDSYTVNQGAVVSNDGTGQGAATPHSAPNQAELSTRNQGDTAILISPELKGLATGGNRLRLWATNDNNSADSLFIGYLTDTSDMSSFTHYDTLGALGNQNYQADTIRFAGDYNGPDSAHIGFFRIEASAGGPPQSSATYVDDIVYEEIPTCPAPTDLSVSKVMDSSATIDWVSQAPGSEWQLAYDTSGFQLGTGARDTTSKRPYTITGLMPLTSYDVYVREICGAGDSSNWAGPISFTTPCPSFTATYTHAFDSLQPPMLDECWSSLENTGSVETDTQTDQGDTAASDPNLLELNDGDITIGDTAMAITPRFSDLSTGQNRVRFYGKRESNGSTESIIVGVMSDSTNGATLTMVDTIQDELTFSWKEFTVALDSSVVSADDRFVAFIHGEEAAEVYLDDIVYEPIPSCRKPENLSASNITSSTARIGWTSNATDSLWQVAYDTTGFMLGKGSRDTTSNDPYTLSGLMENESYDVYVREICEAGDTSEWTGPVTFTTPCDSFMATYTHAFDNLQTPALSDCWSKIEVNADAEGVATASQTDQGENPVSDPNLLELNNGNITNNDTAIAITPLFKDLSTGENRVRFYGKRESNGSTESIIIGVMKDSSNSGSLTLVDTIGTELAFSWKEFIIDLDSTEVSANDRYLAFIHGEANAEVYLDDIIYEPIPSCLRPDSLMSSNPTDSSVVLDWVSQNSGGATWQVSYGEPGFDPDNGTMDTTDSNPYTLTGLASGTHYEVYIREICGAGDTSIWSRPDTFNTLCNSAYTATYKHNFDSVQAALIDPCWSTQETGGLVEADTATEQGNAPVSSPNLLRMNAGNITNGDTALLISPQLTDLPTDSNQVRFMARAGQNGANETIVVGVMSHPDSGSTFVPVDTMALSNTGFEEFTVFLNDSTAIGSKEYVAFMHGQDNAPIYLDDIVYEPIPFGDVGATAIYEPMAQENCTLSDSQRVSIVIENFGATEISDFEAEYQVRGGTVVTDTVTDTIPGGDTTMFTFDQTADLSFNDSLYTIDAWTAFADDPDLSNDSVFGREVENVGNSPLSKTSSLEDSVVIDNQASSELLFCDLDSLDGCFMIKSVTIDSLAHNSPEDMTISLTAPGGNSVRLSNNNGGAAANTLIDVHFSDTATTNPPNGSAFQDNTYYLPVDSLKNLYNGQDPDGRWSLDIDEGFLGAGGTLYQWSLTFGRKAGVSLGPDKKLCAGDSVTLNAGAGFKDFDWNTGDSTQTITVDTAGTFIVTATDTMDCFTTKDTVKVDLYSQPQVNLGPDTTICQNDSLLLEADTGFASYLWQDTISGQDTLTVDSSGTYYIEVTDSNGCVARDTIMVSMVAPQSVDIGPDTSSCEGDSVLLNAGTGFDSYKWNTGSMDSSIYADTTGVYRVEVTDTNGCNNADTANVSFKPHPDSMKLGGDTTICANDSITLSVAAGYDSYTWLDTITDQDSLTVDTAGTYYVEVSNASGCPGTGRDTIQVSKFSAVSVDIGTDTTACKGDTINLDAGPGFASYMWNTDSTNQSIDVDTSGTYWVTVTDSNGCEASDSATIKFKPDPAKVNLGPDTTICANDSITLNVAAGYDSYTWLDTITGQDSLTVDTVGTYYLKVSNASGCTGTGRDTIKVSIDTLPSVELGADTGICQADSLMLDAGSGFDNYEWSTGETGQTIVGDTAGTYSVEAFNDTGCTNRVQDTINIDTRPHPDSMDLGPDISVCDSNSVTLDAGAGYQDYTWNDGSSGQTLTVMSTGTYWVEVSNTDACLGTSRDSVSVSFGNSPTVNLGPDSTICKSQSIQLDAGAGTSYDWSTGASTQTVTLDSSDLKLGSNTIWVKVTDSIGCTGRDTVIVTMDVCSGVDVPKEGDSFHVNLYPNPTDGVLTLETKGLNAPANRIEVSDLQGRKLFKKEEPTFEGGRSKLDVSGLAKGTYFLRIITEKGTETKRFTVQ